MGWVSVAKRAIQDHIAPLSLELEAAGAKVETVQKMDRKSFSRVADKKHSAGFYVNIIFHGAPAALAVLQTKFALNEEVFRVIFTDSPEPKPAK